MRRQLGAALVMLLFLVLLLVSAVWVSHAQPPAREPPPRYPLYRLPRLLPVYDGDAVAASPGEVGPAATRHIPWSRVVFQSYRDRNWEIYLSDDEGAGLARLTDHPATDIEPRLNWGVTRVVFTSNRSGNYDIWVMNADGTGLCQLTSHPATDAAPAWSRDGQKILFESERTGQSEVFIMNADGSGQVQLTAGGGYNGQPSFSPDGSKIAFVSARTGGYRIWVMNRDGSGLKQLSNQAYSAHPVWSPDGTTIGYDADHDQDGDQTLWTMNGDGTSQVERVDIWDEQLWAGSWSPLSSDLAFTRVILVEYAGQIYWYNARLFFWRFRAGGCPPGICAITQHGTEWYPDWQTTDIAPPRSRVKALPERSPQAGFAIHWEGLEVGESGLAGYDIQYRIGAAGQWTFLLTHTQSTTAGFAGQPGTTVYFRSRARDRNGNEEAWPEAGSGDTHTTFYTWKVDGVVRDARGIGLPAPVLEIVPQGLPAAIGPEPGHYTAYLVGEGSHAITVSHAGYAPLRMALEQVTTDTMLEHWLPPLDNRMENGGWESGGALGWELSGPVPAAVVGSAAHHGQWGLSLGPNPGAATSWEVWEGPPEPRAPAAAWDAGGVAHVAWNAGDVLQYSACTASGVCSPVEVVGQGERPAIAAGGDGSAHVIWLQAGQVMYSHRPPGGGWSPAQPLAPSGGDYALDVDASGVPHAAWSNDGQVYYSRQSADSTWLQPEQTPETEWRAQVVDIAAAPDRVVHVVCGEGYSCMAVWHTARLANGQWTDPHGLSGNCHLPTLQVAADASGGVHVAWRAWVLWQWPLKRVHWAYRSADGAWREDGVYQSKTLDNVGLVLQSGGRPLCLWWTEGGTHASYLLPNDSWSAARLVQPASWPDDSVVAYAAWPSTDMVALVTVRAIKGIAGVYAAAPELHPEVAGEGAAHQVVVVGTELHRPVLALDYAFGAEQPNAGDHLMIALNGATEITTVMVSQATSGWQHVWFDLSEQRGQTITLTVGMSATADERYSWAMVDDITLGSWLTPVILAVSPDHVADPSTLPLTLTVHGGNFVAVPTVRVGAEVLAHVNWVDEQTLEVVLPPSVGLGMHDVWVSNPDGQAGVLPAALKVGRAIHLPFVRRAEAPW